MRKPAMESGLSAQIKVGRRNRKVLLSELCFEPELIRIIYAI